MLCRWLSSMDADPPCRLTSQEFSITDCLDTLGVPEEDYILPFLGMKVRAIPSSASLARPSFSSLGFLSIKMGTMNCRRVQVTCDCTDRN